MSEPDGLQVAPQSPDRNLALELVRVTEAAAMAAASVTRTSSRARVRSGAGGSTARASFMDRTLSVVRRPR